MKKLLLAGAALLCVATAYGQGRVAFLNNSTTPISTNTTSIGGASGPTSGAGNFYFGLYVGTLGTPSNALTLNILATNSGIAGRLTGGSPAPLVAPHADGTTYPLTFQIRGWSAAGGTSYEAALLAQATNPNILTGASILGQVTPTFAPVVQAALFGTSGGGLVPGFALAPGGVPEPSSIALGLLGLGAIALFRRRK